MVEFLEGKALSKYLLDKYSKNPNGWSFVVFPSSKEDNGFFGALVGGPEEVWQLKVDSIFKPNPLMLGAKVEADQGRLNNSGLAGIPYGYRKLDRRVAYELLRALIASEDSEPQQQQQPPVQSQSQRQEDLRRRSNLARLNIERLLGSLRPVAPVSGETYAEGPFVLTDRESLGITEGQKQLEDRLSSELRKLMRNRYVGYG